MYNSTIKNYSFQSVEIPSGTVVEMCNFAQLIPNTECIFSSGSVVLKNCNLLNVKLKPEWEVIECLTAQAWLIAEIVEEDQVCRTRQYICSHPSQLTGNEVAPENVILVKDF